MTGADGIGAGLADVRMTARDRERTPEQLRTHSRSTVVAGAAGLAPSSTLATLRGRPGSTLAPGVVR